MEPSSVSRFAGKFVKGLGGLSGKYVKTNITTKEKHQSVL
jgi:hypothetical protein